MEQVECIVAGAGVVGLAIARALAEAGRDVVVVEAADAIGTSTSSRNSEVIHAGIYYEPGSLKAQLCVRGRDLLYAFCESHGVGHKRIGKLIVAAAPEEAAYLENLANTGAANGVDDLTMLSAAEARALEPALAAHAALLSPSTGIVDSHGLMLALLGDLEAADGMLALSSPIMAAEVRPDRIVLTTGGPEPMTLGCRLFVNSAGLDAPALARSISGMPAHLVPQETMAKGSYFTCQRRVPFSHLIYPVPEVEALAPISPSTLAGRAASDPTWNG